MKIIYLIGGPVDLHKVAISMNFYPGQWRVPVFSDVTLYSRSETPMPEFRIAVYQMRSELTDCAVYEYVKTQNLEP